MDILIVLIYLTLDISNTLINSKNKNDSDNDNEDENDNQNDTYDILYCIRQRQYEQSQMRQMMSLMLLVYDIQTVATV